MKRFIRVETLAAFAVALAIGVGALFAPKIMAQSHNNGWITGNAVYMKVPQSDPTVYNLNGIAIYVPLDGGGGTIYDALNKKPHQLAMTEIRCGTLTDAGGSGKSCASTAGACGVALPYTLSATCQCNTTNTLASGLAPANLSVYVDGGNQLNVVGGDITALDSYCCTCSGI